MAPPTALQAMGWRVVEYSLALGMGAVLCVLCGLVAVWVIVRSARWSGIFWGRTTRAGYEGIDVTYTRLGPANTRDQVTISRATLNPQSKGAGQPPPPQSEPVCDFQDTFADPTTFKPAQDTVGLDFGLQYAQKYFWLHRKTHETHGLIMYQQSERSKWVQGALHLGTVGRCTSVHKCAAFLFNDSDSLALAQRIWPDAVMMDDFGDVVIRKLGGCELARCKIRKGHYTFYLYYVKKEGAKLLRKASWDHMLTTIAGMDDIADWGRICAEVLCC